MNKVLLSVAAVFVLVGVALVVAVGTSKADQDRPGQAQVVRTTDQVTPGGPVVAKQFCPAGWKVADFKSDKDYNCVPKSAPKPAECKGPYWECTACKCRCWPYEPPK